LSENQLLDIQKRVKHYFMCFSFFCAKTIFLFAVEPGLTRVEFDRDLLTAANKGSIAEILFYTFVAVKQQIKY